MGKLKTNRDLYRFVVNLSVGKEAQKRPIEEYLRALWSLAKRHRDFEAIELNEFARMLEEAFTAPAPESVSMNSEPGKTTEGEFEKWERTLLLQIRTLQRMEKDGSINDRLRYLNGVTSPGGTVWYNFDPGAYLEGGVWDAFGGWESEDESYLEFPDGDSTSQNEKGAIPLLDPRHRTKPAIRMPHVTWRGFTKFINCGRGHG